MKTTASTTPPATIKEPRKRRYHMIDTVMVHGERKLRLRGTCEIFPSQVATYANSMGCRLMRHLPRSLK